MQYNAIKLGITESISERDSQYATGEIIRGEFYPVYQIINSHLSLKEIESKIKSTFAHLNIYVNGGTEFFNIQIIDFIEEFLSTEDIIYESLSKTAISELLHMYKENENILPIKDENEGENKENENIFPIKDENEGENILTPEEINRNLIQEKYIDNIRVQLDANHKCFVKAPTGFGKTHIFYKIIKYYQFNKILFLSPRKTLNIQMVSDEYFIHLNKNEYMIKHFSEYQKEQKMHEM